MKEIKRFFGEYSFMSNFYPSPILYQGMSFPTVEHAFQASKAIEPVYRKAIQMTGSPGHARSLGRSGLIRLRPDWEDVKVDIMLDLLRRKFAISDLQSKLYATGDAYLEEGNQHGDRFWGTVDGKGENYLGILLMIVRSEINALLVEGYRSLCPAVWERPF